MLASGLLDAMALARAHPKEVLLLGFAPDEPDADLGYIETSSNGDSPLVDVRRFIEKPEAQSVQALIDRGALWNSFIVAGSANALLDLFERLYPTAVAALRDYVTQSADGAQHLDLLARIFNDLPSIDFSEDVLEKQPEHLKVVRLPPCGWSDLGTPARLARTVRRNRAAIDRVPVAPPAERGRVDLAQRWHGAH